MKVISNCKKIFHTVFAPSELWVHTVLLSTNILTEEEKEKMLIPKEKYQKLIGVAPLHYFEYEGAIKILNEEDYDKIMDSGKMFIRKVKTGSSEKLIRLLDENREKY